MKTLVSLISDQQIPNVCLIKELDPELNLFITTKRMEEKHQSDKIINTLNLRNYEKIEVNEEDYNDVFKKLSEKVKINSSDQLIINITGGTKIMSLAAFTFGIEKNAEIYYLPIKSDKYLQLNPFKKDSSSIKITVSLTLEEYLNSYSKKDKNSGYNYDRPYKSEEEADIMFSLFEKNKLDEELINRLREYRNKDLILDNSNEKHREIFNFIKSLENNKIKFPDLPKLTKRDSKYLTGEWFEEWTYYKIKKFFNLDDKSISLSVKRKDTQDNPHNEFDVMFLINNELKIIECKTSLKEIKQNKEKEYALFEETLYKSASLLKEFGLTAKTCLFTLSRKPDNEEKLKDMKKKSNFFNIKTLFKEDLLSDNLEATLKEAFK